MEDDDFPTKTGCRFWLLAMALGGLLWAGIIWLVGKAIYG